MNKNVILLLAALMLSIQAQAANWPKDLTKLTFKLECDWVDKGSGANRGRYIYSNEPGLEIPFYHGYADGDIEAQQDKDRFQNVSIKRAQTSSGDEYVIISFSEHQRYGSDVFFNIVNYFGGSGSMQFATLNKDYTEMKSAFDFSLRNCMSIGLPIK